MAAALALAVGAVPVFAGGLSLAQKHESRHEIDQLEDGWRTAALSGDVKTMDSLLADDYMAITAAGTLQSRDETLANLRSGRLHFTSLATIEATNPEGPVTGDYRYTHVYVRNAEGQWKIVSSEASHVRKPGPHKRNEFH